jgi:hypothetical protein
MELSSFIDLLSSITTLLILVSIFNMLKTNRLQSERMDTHSQRLALLENQAGIPQDPHEEYLRQIFSDLNLQDSRELRETLERRIGLADAREEMREAAREWDPNNEGRILRTLDEEGEPEESSRSRADLLRERDQITE